MTEDEARAAIGEAGLSVGRVDYEPSQDVAADTGHQPGAQRPVRRPGLDDQHGRLHRRPDGRGALLVGQDRAAARDVLKSRNLKVKFSTKESDAPKDQVIETTPGAGQNLPEGSVVTVVVSDGPETVPAVRGHEPAAGREGADARPGSAPTWCRGRRRRRRRAPSSSRARSPARRHRRARRSRSSSRPTRSRPRPRRPPAGADRDADGAAPVPTGPDRAACPPRPRSSRG